jgi:hypothetical protein
VFVPKSLGPLSAVRQLFMSRLSDRFSARTAGRLIPRLEREVAALGRSFGEHCVEVGNSGPHVETQRHGESAISGTGRG